MNVIYFSDDLAFNIVAYTYVLVNDFFTAANGELDLVQVSGEK